MSDPEDRFYHNTAHFLGGRIGADQTWQLHSLSVPLFYEINRFSPEAAQNEPRCEKTGLRGFRPGSTQIGLYSHRRCLEA